MKFDNLFSVVGILFGLAIYVFTLNVMVTTHKELLLVILGLLSMLFVFTGISIYDNKNKEVKNGIR